MPPPRWTQSALVVGVGIPQLNRIILHPSVGYHDPYKLFRMTDSSSIDNDLVSLAPTVASILGIKGSLRFRPHGSSQKAHVVLRRVEPESDSDGEGDNKGVAQFSLFAYKRIEVKPGKEILLTVADGPFKDRAIIFEGDELESSSLSDAEEQTQVAEDDDAPLPTEHSLPLKMRKPWVKRLEAPLSLGSTHEPHPRATHQSVGIQTEQVITSEHTTLGAPEPAPEDDSKTVLAPPSRGPPGFIPSNPINFTAPCSSVCNVSVPNAGLLPEGNTPTLGLIPPRQHPERDHTLFLMGVGTTTTPIQPSTYDPISVPPAPAKHDDVPTETSTNLHSNVQPERWSPSVPAPVALPATVRPVDDTSESTNASSAIEDRDSLLLAPERPWSPSVPAVLSIQPLSRHNIRGREMVQSENFNDTRPSAEGPPASSSPSPPPPTPPSPLKIAPHMKPKSKLGNSFISGGFVTDFVGKSATPSLPDEDNKAHLLPEKISSPSAVPRPSQLTTFLSHPQPSSEIPQSPSFPTQPFSPRPRKDHSPSRLSPTSSRGSFSYGPLESSATSVPSHPSSPRVSVRKPQAFPWPPFRPSLDDGVADFDPPFRAGPDFCEPTPPPPFGPARAPVWPQVPTWHLPPPGRSSPPPTPSFYNTQPFGSPSLPAQLPPKTSQVLTVDNIYPPRQPRSEAALQAMASISLGQGMVPRSHPQYYRHQRYPHASRSPSDGRGRGTPMAAGAKRKASPPRTEPAVLLEIPPKRTPPSTWPTVSPIRCVAMQGDPVAVQGITFNRTGKLMAVTRRYTIRVWDNVTYSEVARLPHSTTVVSAQWMDDDAGVLALCADGALVRWTRPAGNTPPRAHDIWHWGRLAEPAIGGTPDDVPTALAYKGDRIAASFPKFGVRIWMMKQGSWQPQRPIIRQNVTAIEFVDDGAALLGGTKDGVLWHCQVIDGAPRVHNFFKARICGIDVLPAGTHALVSQQVGRAHLVAISQDENRGKVMQVYTVEPGLQAEAVYDANALFVGRDDAVLYGSAGGYLFAWDKTSASILVGLDHGEGRHRRSGAIKENCVVTGSRNGKLCWWAEPVESATVAELHTGKRVKTS
ncbi:hypothetical protein B0F90DRAFT_1711649 [Multifurca ochricompacta]|uniref:Uncharacterized protein n=1 Tax=Multifurca ochricompacta TaxID=376703 RepID=A0AAD4QM51_9AGAM|nr:hypothetical protein B0F90DRAFT_1711649 [Multifurca ochricompacta]